MWVVVDESFIEYCDGLTCLPQLSAHSCLIILRSLTKFYGLPGLRVGYSLSSPHVAELLRRYLPPWSVNMVAQRAAEAAGLAYAFLPVQSSYQSPAEIARMHRLLQQLPKPVLGFCRSGTRTANLFRAAQALG